MMSSIAAMMRSLSSYFEVTRIWPRPERASSEKQPSTRFNQEPSLGVKLNWKRPSGWAVTQALVSFETCAE